MVTFILAVTAAVVVAVVFRMADVPVASTRLARFARRQKLTVTLDNGNQIIAYLAMTRRWRAAGVAAGILGPIVWTEADYVGVNLLALFAGWFAGAIVAEARVEARTIGPRRAASLQARRPRAYLSRFSWTLVPASAGASLALAAVTISYAYLAPAYNVWARPDWTAVLWPAAAVGVAVVVRVTQRRVLRRPQPHAEPDIIAADDAIRSRSLHVLAGGGAALVLSCVAAQLDALGLRPQHPAFATVSVIQVLAYLAIPVLGWNVGAWVWRVRRDPDGLTSPA